MEEAKGEKKAGAKAVKAKEGPKRGINERQRR